MLCVCSTFLEEAQQLLFEEKITAGHARAILSVQTPANRLKLTEKLKNEKISVREAESIARLMVGREKRRYKAAEASGAESIQDNRAFSWGETSYEGEDE